MGNKTIGKMEKICIILLFLSIIPGISGEAFSAQRVDTDIRIIHALTGPRHMDPALKDLGRELRSVFKYSEYRLLNRKNMILSYNQNGVIGLPGARRLEIVPVNFIKGRIKFNIRIFKKGKSVFTTEVLLRNGSSITIGGPGFKKGYLLFNISGMVR